MSDRAAKQAAELVDTRATPIESESVGTLVTALESELADRLREVGSVGRGGMARVDLVHDQALDRRVVMKRLHDQIGRAHV
jgi:hypothetical protein